MTELKIAMILNTDGLEYDDRIRKEILSIQRHMPYIAFKIFAIVPDNRAETGITDYGIPYELLSLQSREKYSSSSHLISKAYEFYKRVKPALKDFDVIWCADCHVFFFPLLMPKNTKIVWDLHELPEPFMKNSLMKVIFKYLEKKSNLIFHANEERINYLKSVNMVNNPAKHFALRNYPDIMSLTQSEEAETKIYIEFKDWLGQSECVYIQGIYEKERRSYESMAAICSIDNLKAVVVGSVDEKALHQLQKDYGKDFVKEKIFFTGRVPQKKTKLFIGLCKYSLIFYATSTPNNNYCEPNRLFQTVLSGLPVVVGCNPPMKQFVNDFGVGISLSSDGDNISEIIEAIRTIMANYEYYRSNIEKNIKNFVWENQDNILVDALKQKLKI